MKLICWLVGHIWRTEKQRVYHRIVRCERCTATEPRFDVERMEPELRKGFADNLSLTARAFPQRFFEP